MAITVEKIGEIKNQLGEGPVWDVGEKALYWTDANAPAIYRLDPKTNDVKTWKMPKPIGSFAIREKGGAVLAMSDGFYLFDFKSGDAKQIGDPVAKPGTQFNDGKTDARGRFIAGTLDSKFAGPLGSIVGGAAGTVAGVGVAKRLELFNDRVTVVTRQALTDPVFAKSLLANYNPSRRLANQRAEDAIVSRTEGNGLCSEPAWRLCRSADDHWFAVLKFSNNYQGQCRDSRNSNRQLRPTGYYQQCVDDGQGQHYSSPLRRHPSRFDRTSVAPSLHWLGHFVVGVFAGSLDHRVDIFLPHVTAPTPKGKWRASNISCRVK